MFLELPLCTTNTKGCMPITVVCCSIMSTPQVDASDKQEDDSHSEADSEDDPVERKWYESKGYVYRKKNPKTQH